MKKITKDLLDELKAASDINSYSKCNADAFKTLTEHLDELLAARNIQKSEAIEKSCLGKYAYEIFNGTKKNYSRDKIICLCLGLSLTLTETQQVLRFAKQGELYPRNKRDAAIIFCIGKGNDVMETDHQLLNFGEKPLLTN